ncbi:hypothetical protein [Herpetosiphon llansteffanensis]|uniref:hypothetical protein n=1 Tax=Herpetosiphon llansteffanensis TaxID=2094568 RepID=UPI000D7C6DCF|nr:hypothetical protein [Herpetosiphon llansteffanensis]
MMVSFETLVQVLPTLTKQQKQTLFVLLQAEHDQDAHLHALNQQFWREPTLEALIAEQRPRVIQSLDDFAAPWWPEDESVEDFEAFLAESRASEAAHE